MAEVRFVRFVSAVPGRLVSRWDSPGTLIGARITTEAERSEGAEPILWDEAVVLPLTDGFCRRYDLELRRALRNGDLKERKEADWKRWLEVEEDREQKRIAEIEAEKKRVAEEAEKAAEAAEIPSGTDAGNKKRKP